MLTSAGSASKTTSVTIKQEESSYFLTGYHVNGILKVQAPKLKTIQAGFAPFVFLVISVSLQNTVTSNML